MRVRRPLLATLVLGLVPSSLAAAQGFEYAPGTAQYKVTQTTRVSQEMMGQKQDGQSSSLQLLTMTLTRPSKDTVLATYVIDSVHATTPMGTPAPSLDRYKGMKVEVKVAPTGSVVYSVKGPTETEVPNASSLVTALGGYLPRMRATLGRGMTWSDTVSGKLTQFGIELDRKIYSRAEVVKDTTIGGTPAWKVQRNDSTTIAGSGNSANGPMSMEGNSLGKTTFYVTSKGMLLGADGTENSKVRVVLSANGMEINLTTSAETKVEKVK
jgi:hypothetical protein